MSVTSEQLNPEIVLPSITITAVPLAGMVVEGVLVDEEQLAKNTHANKQSPVRIKNDEEVFIFVKNK